MARQNDDAGGEESYQITCAMCGEEAEVPFEPKRNQDTYCRDCYLEYKGDIAEERRQKAPRVRHGTRVSFSIICSECGEEKTLDYAPRGVPLDEVMCADCMADKRGEGSRYSDVRKQKEHEQTHEWEIECAECGREDYLKFEPKPGRDYLCTRCFSEQEEPAPERLEGKKAVRRAVYIRKPDDS